MRLALEHLSKQFKNKIAVDNVNTVLKEGIYGFFRSKWGRKNHTYADGLRNPCANEGRGES